MQSTSDDGIVKRKPSTRVTRTNSVLPKKRSTSRENQAQPGTRSKSAKSKQTSPSVMTRNSEVKRNGKRSQSHQQQQQRQPTAKKRRSDIESNK